MTVQTDASIQSDSALDRGARSVSRSRWGEFPPPPPIRPRAAEEEVRTGGVLGRLAATVLLGLITPVLLLVALTVKLESPGSPVLYRQERVGHDRRRRQLQPKGEYTGGERRRNRGFGRPFMIWKFRTMIPNAEAQTGPVWALQRDPRVTRVGRVLRHLRLDELPQLMNVVRGEMSLIGPRPERPHFVEQLSSQMPAYERRLTVPPGITGLAQVEREYDQDLNDVRTKLKYDLFYVEHRSALMDFKILVKTIDVMLRGRGAR